VTSRGPHFRRTAKLLGIAATEISGECPQFVGDCPLARWRKMSPEPAIKPSISVAANNVCPFDE
jgi:hypothetical protein